MPQVLNPEKYDDALDLLKAFRDGMPVAKEVVKRAVDTILKRLNLLEETTTDLQNYFNEKIGKIS